MAFADGLRSEEEGFLLVGTIGPIDVRLADHVGGFRHAKVGRLEMILERNGFGGSIEWVEEMRMLLTFLISENPTKSGNFFVHRIPDADVVPRTA